MIVAIVGLDTIATMHMDATIREIHVTETSVKQMFFDICEIPLKDEVTFSFISIEEIRESEEYYGYRLSLTENFNLMAVSLKLDITKGEG